ncbi:MAG: PQQ-binding-like beta-propeller repeat protein [Candidatus Bathyarchaeota archaeon]|nr:PQQ-binding-like beta-propeller repeat protein [Candidatus Bathyarchaeota archaeon]
MKHRYWILVALLTTILIQTYGACQVTCTTASSTTDNWTMFQYGPNRCGYTNCGDTTNSAELLWAFTTGASVYSSPVVTNSSVIIGAGDGHVYCLNASDGASLWQYSNGSTKNYYSSPAVSEGRLYIGSSDGNLTCIDSGTGLSFWVTNLNGAVWSSPLILNGCVYVGSKDCNFYCLNASNGDTLWRYPVEGTLGSSPAFADGIVYFSSDYYVYAVNVTTREEVWHTFTESGSNSPAIYEGCLYIGANDGTILCLNAYTGVINWKYVTYDSVVSSPAAAYGCIYIGSEDTNLYCLNASTGEKIWQTPTGYWICSSPIVSGGNVYICSQDYNIYCLDAFTGSIKWSYSTGAAVNASPAIADNTLYIGSDDNLLYAFTLCNSTENNPPPRPDGSLKFSTMVIDTVACALFIGIIPAFAFLFVKSKRRTGQPVDLEAQKMPWYKKHIDLLCVLVILSFAIILFLNLENSILWVDDEQTYSQWSFHMLKTGDYLTPWNFGITSLWIGKPPLNMWLVSLAYQFFGVSNFSSRFWSALFGGLSLVLMYYLGKTLYNRYVGMLSALVLGTFTMFYTFATRLMTDVPLVFFILASIYFMILSEKTKHPLLYPALSGLFFGLALMTKQTEALLIPAIAFTYLVLTRRNLVFLFTKRVALFFGVALLVFAPWLIAMSVRFGMDFWNYYFLYSTYIRVISPIEGHVGGFLFYFNYIATHENLLWLILLPFSVGLSLYWAIKRSKSDLLLITWIAIVFLVFTIAQTKLHYYILPVYPAFALAIGSLLYQLSKKIWSSTYPHRLNLESKTHIAALKTKIVSIRALLL